MKKILFAAIFLSSIISSNAQVNVQWESRYSSAGANIDQAIDTHVDAAGNTYITGTSFNSGTGFDLVTVKYDALGAQLWTATFNGPASSIDEAFALDYDPAGFVYVTGYVFNGGPDYDVVLLKIDANSGAIVWNRTFDYQGYYDLGRDVVVDSNGDIYVVGSGQYNASGNDTDYLILKYSSSGALLWDDIYSVDITAPHELDEGRKLKLNGDKLYITGTSAGNSSTSNFDFVTLEYDTSQGGVPNYNWRTRYDYNGFLDIPVGIEIDGSGNIFVGGRGYEGPLEDVNYVLVKYNSAGTQQWAAAYNDSTGVSGKDNMNALVVDAAGNCIVTGSSILSGSAEDIYTIKYDPNGNALWENRYTTSGAFFDEATDILIGPADDIYLTGTSFISGGNDNDFTTIKYTPAGVEEWVIHYDGAGNASDKALAMHVDPSENIFVTGTSVGVGTAQDYMTIKYCQLETEAGNDTSICVGDNVQLLATGATNFMWDVVSGDPINIGGNFSCNNCPNPIASPSATTVYAVSSTNAAGCVDFDTVIVTVNPLPGPNITASGPTSFCIGDSVTLSSDSYSAYSWNTGSINDSVVADTAGNYIVTVTDSMGCLNSTSIAVTVYALPNVDAGLPDSLCPGDSTQLMASNASSFIWNMNTDLSSTVIPDPWAYPTQDTTYYVEGTDGNGCKNYDSVTVHVYPAPIAPAIADFSSSNPPFLQSSSLTGNQWYMNGLPVLDSTNQKYFFDMTADYWVLYTDGNGCSIFSDTVSAIFVGDTTTDTTSAINELAINHFDLYPNPSEGLIRLDVETSKALDLTAVVMDLNGKVIWRRELSRLNGQTLVEIDLSPFESGLYLVRLISDKGHLTKRVVKR
jgi:hypothetical protein